MTPYKISSKNKAKFKRAAIRIIRELIMADAIIDNEELHYFEAYCQPYSATTHLIGELDSKLYRFDLSPKEILDSQSLTLSDALMSFKALRMDEMKFFGTEAKMSEYYADDKVSPKYKIYLTKNFIGALEVLSRCDGSCDVAEAKLCIILNYILRKPSTFAFSYKDVKYRFAKNELIYVSHKDNAEEMSNTEISHIVTRLNLFGYKYVTISDTQKALLSKNGVIESLLSFVYPSIFILETESNECTKQTRIDLVREAVSKITEPNFIKAIFNDTPLPRIKEPYILVKIGKSKVEINHLGNRSKTIDDFICIPIEGSFVRFVDELTDDILVLAHNVNASCSISVEKPLVIKGFAKTLMDFAIYQASEAISKITIDLTKCEMRFGGIIPNVHVPAREISMYVFVAILSRISNGLNKNPKRGKQLRNYCNLFERLGDLTLMPDTDLKLESKYITSNISTLLNANTLIRDISKLVPSKGTDYTAIDNSTLNLIEIVYRNAQNEKKKSNLDQFWTEYLEPHFEQKEASFEENTV